MPFDRDTGVVYSEEIVPLKRSSQCRHENWCCGSKPRSLPAPEGGAHTLRTIATRRILCNLDLIEPDTLRASPLPVLEDIWQAILLCELDSARSWQILAQTQLGTRDFVHTWRERSCPTHRLPYFIDLAAKSDCWLTRLTFSCVDIPLEDLIYVAKLRNVQTIHVSGARLSPRNTFGDRITRGWAQASRHEGAFSKLDMLFVDNCQDVTARSLEHLASLPVLEAVCMQDCGIDRSDIIALPMAFRGWEIDDDGSPVAYLGSKRRTTYPHAPVWTTQLARCIKRSHRTVTADMADYPVLNLDLSIESLNRHAAYSPWQTMCLTRNRSVADKLTDEESRESKSSSDTDPPAPKRRRRLRGGKSVALNDMLAGM